MDARLEQRQGQKPILKVFYDPIKRNWDQVIRQALEQHGIKDRLGVLVVAVPAGMDR